LVSLRLGDQATPREATVLPAVIVLDRLRSAYNTGNIFRLADAVRAEGICACGYTPCPPHDRLAKTAMGCDQTVPCKHFDETSAALQALRAQGRTLYAVDTVVGAKCFWNCDFHFPCAFVFGNEALGISSEALALCDDYVQLPAAGLKNSINVGNCAAVILFEALRQYRKTSASQT